MIWNETKQYFLCFHNNLFFVKWKFPKSINKLFVIFLFFPLEHNYEYHELNIFILIFNKKNKRKFNQFIAFAIFQNKHGK